MEHTRLVPAVQRSSEPPVLPGPSETHERSTAPGDGQAVDLTPLVHQLYARLRRELQIERERRSGP